MPAFTPYISKDFVIHGSLLELNPEAAWEKIHKRTRTAIRKARTYNPRLIKVKGNADDIAAFRAFCPNRDDLPVALYPEQHMYFAYVGDTLAGGIIVTELADRLYLHFHAATEEGKRHNIPSLLLWHIVEEFAPSRFSYLDVGASYRPSLQNYFSSWATKRYPIIMRPPEYKPQILIGPVENTHLTHPEHAAAGDTDTARRHLRDFFRTDEYTFFPRGMYAIYALMKWLALEGRLRLEDEVCIRTTTESPYISSCVTTAIEQICRWSRELTDRTKAIFVIHEFGFVHPDIKELRRIATERGIPLIEDSAYAWGSGDAGRYGDYTIYSLTKIFPAQFGGFLVGKKFDHAYMWKNFGCADSAKEEIALKTLGMHLAGFDAIAEKRRKNYDYYRDVFGDERTFFGAPAAGVIPGAYMLRMADEGEMQEISAFVRQFGIECGNYWKNSAIFLPVHQNLTPSQLDYIAGAVYGAGGYEKIAQRFKH
ncbi:MAG: GNAT family N-acetyltransferase [Patescibacteria group bacterium]